MKYRLLDLIQCPNGHALTVEDPQVTYIGDQPEVLEGSLVCACGSWPIRGGIPRFLPDDLPPDVLTTQETFAEEWKNFRFGERNWGQSIESRRNRMLMGMGVSAEDMRGKIIFDAGCGSGVLSLDFAGSLGMEVIAMDLTAPGIEQAYAYNMNSNVHFIQGSVITPPIRPGICDYIYCCGVLVHVPDPIVAFGSVGRALKSGGRMMTWWYHPVSALTDTRKKTEAYLRIRAVTTKLPISIQRLLYLSLMPPFIAKQALARLRGQEFRATWREKMQAMWDFFSPTYQHRFSPEEVKAMYRAHGYSGFTVAYSETEGYAVRGNLSKVAMAHAGSGSNDKED